MRIPFEHFKLNSEYSTKLHDNLFKAMKDLRPRLYILYQLSILSCFSETEIQFMHRYKDSYRCI